jgi:hypothetical protein
MRFKMSDFKVLDRVSIGLGGRVSQKSLLQFFFLIFIC